MPKYFYNDRTHYCAWVATYTGALDTVPYLPQHFPVQVYQGPRNIDTLKEDFRDYDIDLYHEVWKDARWLLTPWTAWLSFTYNPMEVTDSEYRQRVNYIYSSWGQHEWNRAKKLENTLRDRNRHIPHFEREHAGDRFLTTIGWVAEEIKWLKDGLTRDYVLHQYLYTHSSSRIFIDHDTF